MIKEQRKDIDEMTKAELRYKLVENIDREDFLHDSTLNFCWGGFGAIFIGV